MFPFLPFFQLFGKKVFQVFTSDLDPIVTCCHSSLFILNFASLSLYLSLSVGLARVCQFRSPLQSQPRFVSCSFSFFFIAFCPSLGYLLPPVALGFGFSIFGVFICNRSSFLMWAPTAANFPLRTNTAFYNPLKFVQICFMLAILFWKLCHKNLERMQLLDVMFGKYPAGLLG